MKFLRILTMVVCAQGFCLSASADFYSDNMLEEKSAYPHLEKSRNEKLKSLSVQSLSRSFFTEVLEVLNRDVPLNKQVKAPQTQSTVALALKGPLGNAIRDLSLNPDHAAKRIEMIEVLEKYSFFIRRLDTFEGTHDPKAIATYLSDMFMGLDDLIGNFMKIRAEMTRGLATEKLLDHDIRRLLTTYVLVPEGRFDQFEKLIAGRSILNRNLIFTELASVLENVQRVNAFPQKKAILLSTYHHVGHLEFNTPGRAEGQLDKVSSDELVKKMLTARIEFFRKIAAENPLQACPHALSK